MDGDNTHSEMAETLMVLAGDNALAAAMAFRARALRDGDAAGARHWRMVARAVLKTRTARAPLEIALPRETAITAAPPPEKREPVAERRGLSAVIYAHPEYGSAPIPLRARQGAWHPAVATAEPPKTGDATNEEGAAPPVSKAA